MRILTVHAGHVKKVMAICLPHLHKRVCLGVCWVCAVRVVCAAADSGYQGLAAVVQVTLVAGLCCVSCCQLLDRGTTGAKEYLINVEQSVTGTATQGK